MDRSKVVPKKLDENLDEDEIDEEMLDLMFMRRGSADVRKPPSWIQKLNPRLVFARGSRSGTQSPIPPSRLTELKYEGLRNPGRSKSVDFGGSSVSPLSSVYAKKMFSRDQEIVEGVQSDYTTEVDREVQSITSRKVPAQPPPGTVEYTVCGRESLASIAAKHKSTTSELIKINKMMSSLVFPGQKIFVPTEDYVPVGYGSQTSSPRTSPKNLSPKNRLLAIDLNAVPRHKSLDPDEAKKIKKLKNRLKDRRPSDTFVKVQKFLQLRSNSDEGAIFTASVDYVTGGKDPNISGMLEISRREVKFEPDLAENDLGLLQELVRYRMSLGKAMVSANIIDTNPYSQILLEQKGESDEGLSNPSSDPGVKSPDPNDVFRESSPPDESVGASETTNSNKQRSWSDDFMASHSGITFGFTDAEGEKVNDPTARRKDSDVANSSSSVLPAPPSQPSSPPPEATGVRYLLVKLGIPSKTAKDLPTISSLIRVCLPVHETTTVEHCFQIPEDIVSDLSDFLEKHYPDAFGKTEAESLERFEVLDDLAKPPRRSTGAKPFKRSLSIAEFCHLPLPEMSTQSSILKETHVRILREHLFSSSEGRPWKLVYSSSVHGYSINTLYRSMAKSDLVTLLVIADMNEKVFGAMLPCSIRQSEGFYGNGESYLFSFVPVFQKFSWSGKNSYFLKGNPSNFYIGASDGVFGLWLHDDLNHGRTQRCETFDNDLLTETDEDFYIRCVEVWQFPFSLD